MRYYSLKFGTVCSGASNFLQPKVPNSPLYPDWKINSDWFLKMDYEWWPFQKTLCYQTNTEDNYMVVDFTGPTEWFHTIHLNLKKVWAHVTFVANCDLSVFVEYDGNMRNVGLVNLYRGQAQVILSVTCG